MAIFSIPNITLKGIAVCLPENKVSNYNCDLLTEKEQKLFVKTTGIENRRIADEGVCASDLCIDSAEKLIRALNWNKSEISVLVFVTQTPDYITPSTAIILQERLQLPTSCLAFDVNLGCSGYVYGLSIISSLLQNIPNGKGLLLVGDISSACISPIDKSTVPLFSDAGSATALAQEDNKIGLHFNLENDGKGFDTIIIREGGYRKAFNEYSLTYKEVSEGIKRNAIQLVLNGIDVFNFSISRVPENIKNLLFHKNIKESEINYYLLHQANKIINDTISDNFEGNAEKFISSLKDYGNTSSASIPVTIVTQIAKEIESKKLHLLLCGFGVGLSWGSVYVETEKIICINSSL